MWSVVKCESLRMFVVRVLVMTQFWGLMIAGMDEIGWLCMLVEEETLLMQVEALTERRLVKSGGCVS